MKQEVPILIDEFKPKAEYILVKPIKIEAEKKSESGIVLAIASQKSTLERPTLGEVIAVGDKIEDISEGTIVLWPQTDGIDMEFSDGECILLRYESIIGMKK